MPEMHYVQSSNVASVGYDETSGELHVVFLNSPTVYVYLGVPREVFDGLMAAESKGSYLNREVKSTYKFEKR